MFHRPLLPTIAAFLMLVLAALPAELDAAAGPNQDPNRSPTASANPSASKTDKKVRGKLPVKTRDMNRLSWLEFRELVPGRIDTVLLPTGTLEPHGVTANGADNIAPEHIAYAISGRLDALVAPTIPYGITGTLANYPGAFEVPEAAYRPYFEAVLEGLWQNGFRNIVVLNGHGGPQTAVLQTVAREVANRHRGLRTLVINWWSLTADLVQEIWGQSGGHAGLNETAFMQAIDPKLVDKSRYRKDMAVAYPKDNAWAATPFPAAIGLYNDGQGEPDFDPVKAKRYHDAVIQRVGDLVQSTIAQWDKAKL